jgi:integration host factor subunit beta
MTKSELILRIGKLNPHFDHRDVERIVATIFDEIALRKADLERPT